MQTIKILRLLNNGNSNFRFGRWAKEEEKKELTDADIVEKLKKTTGLTNDLLVHSIMLKMKSVPPAAIYALSECDGKVIQQLTLTGMQDFFSAHEESICMMLGPI